MQPLPHSHRYKHATLARAHLQLLDFPVLHEEVSMKFLTVMED